MHDVPVWVLDTNVVISGLLSPVGYPGRLLDMVLSQRLRLALDDRVESEYREVLARPKFGVSDLRAEAFLAILQFQQFVSAPPWPLRPIPDPDDIMFLEVAGQTPDKILVTGNAKHFPAKCTGPVCVLSPRDAWHEFTFGFGKRPDA